MFELLKHYYQRCKYGFSYQDVWSFDDYLCDIIPPAVRKLKEDCCGCPGELWDKERINDECHRWKEILEEIAQGFEAAQKITGLKYFKYEKSKDSPDYFVHEIDEKKAKLLTKKYERGMELFSKYFLSLWS